MATHYTKIEIHSWEDLPEKDGEYFCHFIEKYFGVIYYETRIEGCKYDHEIHANQWIINNIDWYLVEEESELHDSFLGFSGAGQASIETAAKILEDGINDGRYADILDAINVDTETPFFNAVVHFAEDYASQFKEQVPEKITEERLKDIVHKIFLRLLDNHNTITPDMQLHIKDVLREEGAFQFRSEQRQECQHERHYSEIEGYAFCSKCGTPMQ